MPMSEFIHGKCFDGIQIGHIREKEGYSTDWYDADNMDNSGNYYRIYIPERKGDLYLTVESYPSYSIPDECTTGTLRVGGYTYQVSLPIVEYYVYKGSGR